MKKIKELIKDNYFITDGGLETYLIYKKGIDLPHFACFPLIEDPYGKKILKEYYRDYLEIAKQQGAGYILESASYKANPDIGYKLGYGLGEIYRINKLAITQLKELKGEFKGSIDPILISGCLGPCGDAYDLGDKLEIEELMELHDIQLRAFKHAGADLATAYSLNYAEEAVGIALKAKDLDLPVVISFTVEADGKLLDGITLRDAIRMVESLTDAYPEYYMINCAHPDHFMSDMQSDDRYLNRIQAIRANASCKTHEELESSDVLDEGDKLELSRSYGKLFRSRPNLKVMGGCCGTCCEHVKLISSEVLNKEEERMRVER